MKTLLFTGYDDAFAPLGDLTAPLMKQYAQLHGYDFGVYRAPTMDVPSAMNWVGIHGAKMAIEEGYGRIIYLDADQAVTNLDHLLPLDSNHRIQISLDWGRDVNSWNQFSICGFSATEGALPIFNDALALEPDYRDKPFPAQAPLRAVAEEFPFLFGVMARRVFNAVPEEIFPGCVPEPWRAGDWCAHLTHVSLERRIELFHEIVHR